MLPQDDRYRVLVEWNQTAVEYPASECVHKQFTTRRRALRTIALTFDRSLTYRELDEASNRMARLLIAEGVGREVLVGVAMKRSLDLIVALLAILKAGGAYVPLDPTYPRARLESTLDDANPLLVLTETGLAALVPARFRTFCVDSETDTISRQSAAPLKRHSDSGNIVYVIYTSGSTGKPKGVVLEHRNVVNFFTAMDGVLGVGPRVWPSPASPLFRPGAVRTLTRGYRVYCGQEKVAFTPGAHSITSNRDMRRYAPAVTPS
jgi:non-ribosomal peptide synthetase component F